MRERLRREYFRRVKMLLRTELYVRNKVLAINGLALLVLTYSFGVIHWGTTDLQQLDDRRTRKLLTMHGVHHPSADVDRLYAPCNEGGRGLQQIEAMHVQVLHCRVGIRPSPLQGRSKPTDRTSVSETRRLTPAFSLTSAVLPMATSVGSMLRTELAKYGYLRVEISRMWQCRTQVVPVVLGALGTVHAGIARWLEIIPGYHNLQHLQKAVLLGSARILRKVMSSSV